MSKKFNSFKYFIQKQRETQIEDGYFDGRFTERVETSKNKYSRKIKHKKQWKV